METYKLTVNGQTRELTVDPGTPLLWVLREDLKMTGTKYGCGISPVGRARCMLPESRPGRA
jgi:isoquinoline 1-oxidoreductase alpha subunit